MFIDWINQISLCAKGPNGLGGALCPECMSKGLVETYFARRETRFGFAIIYCPTCKMGIKISRAKAPEGVDFVNMDEPYTVPQFKIVTE